MAAGHSAKVTSVFHRTRITTALVLKCGARNTISKTVALHYTLMNVLHHPAPSELV